MVFPIVGGDGKPTGYEISNSLRFNDGDSPALTRTMGAPTSTRKFTYVGWLKRSNLGIQSSFLSWGGSTYATDFRYESSSNSLYFYFDDNTGWYAKTKSVYRDVSAWYQVVLAVDTTQATESNRVKLYVNGTQYGSALDGTDWTQHEIFGQNYDFPELANGQTMAIGKRNSSGSHFFDGYMSEVYFIDGQALDSSYFGETDDNGVWIPKEYDGTYGNNGFLLQFKQTGTSQNSSGIGADTSGNDNHFAVSNLAATDVTTDTPTNNFATLNPLAPINGGAPSTLPTFSEGSTQITVGDGTTRFATGTFATSMPYYFEVKVSAISGSDSDQRIGILDGDAISTSTTYNSVYQGGGVITATGESNATGKDTLTANDIIGVAVDLATNNNIKFYENGDLQATMSVGASYQGLTSTPFARLVNATTTFQFNFGNPSFAISSGNADANGYGNFEYAPPSGYYALCTKNLAQFG